MSNILNKIELLKKRTVQNGCTEAEEIAAKLKIEELKQKYIPQQSATFIHFNSYEEIQKFFEEYKHRLSQDDKIKILNMMQTFKIKENIPKKSYNILGFLIYLSILHWSLNNYIHLFSSYTIGWILTLILMLIIIKIPTKIQVLISWAMFFGLFISLF